MIFDRKRQLNWYTHPVDIYLNQERLVARVSAEGICVRVGGTVRGGDTKILKRGGQTGSRGGHLKKVGSGTPLKTMYNQFLLLKNYRLWH